MAKKRVKLSRRASRRIFKRGAKVNGRNRVVSRRGGIRL